MNWPTPPLGSLVETIVPARDKPVDLGGETPWVRIEDFEGKYLSGSKSGQGVTNETIRSMPLRVFPAGTVACTCSCTMGTTAIVTRPLVTNQTFIGLVPRSAELSSEFLYYALQGHRERLTATATGAIQSYLSREDFRSLRIPIPPLSTQHAIAGYLDQETTQIDALIAAKRRMRELTEERRRSSIEHLLWGHANKLRPPTMLRRVASRIDVGIAEAATHAYETVGVPLLRSMNIRENAIDSTDLLFIAPWFAERNRSKYIYTNDILTVRTGAVGVSALVPPRFDRSQCFTQLITTVAPQHSAEFVSLALNSQRAREYFQLTGWGSAQSNISVPILASAPIPIADLPTQLRVSELARNVNERCEKVTNALTAQLILLSERRRALITAAVTGQLDIPEAA